MAPSRNGRDPDGEGTASGGSVQSPLKLWADLPEACLLRPAKPTYRPLLLENTGRLLGFNLEMRNSSVGT
jgi:hypothetical protein